MGNIYCAIVRAMKEGGEVPRQRWSLQRIVLIRAHEPHSRTISCKGQAHTWFPRKDVCSLRPLRAGRPQRVRAPALEQPVREGVQRVHVDAERLEERRVAAQVAHTPHLRG